mgnify:CR=1 FL=1
MLLLGNKGSHNVATATESVDAPTHTAEISLLICEQMEITDLESGRPPGRAPVNWVELDSLRPDFDMFRNGP